MASALPIFIEIAMKRWACPDVAYAPTELPLPVITRVPHSREQRTGSTLAGLFFNVLLMPRHYYFLYFLPSRVERYPCSDQRWLAVEQQQLRQHQAWRNSAS